MIAFLAWSDHRAWVLVFLATFLSGHLQAASMGQMDHGPFVSWTIRGAGPAPTYKGIALKIGPEDAPATVCFDTDLLRMSAGWTGGFLQWFPERDGLERNPTVEGKIQWENNPGPGWSPTGSFQDPRSTPYGPLPDEWARYQGLYRHGKDVVFSYSVGACQILEKPGFLKLRDEALFSRTFNLGPSTTPLALRLFKVDGPFPKVSSRNRRRFTGVIGVHSETRNRLVGYRGLPRGARWTLEEDHLVLTLPPTDQAGQFQLLISNEPGMSLRDFYSLLGIHLGKSNDSLDLQPLCQGGPALWEPSLKTQPTVAPSTAALVVDNLTVPERNPWHSWIRFGGMDFLSKDQAILGSISGDVWLVSGLGEMKELTWKRFATGLYQPLGIKIVGGKIHVLGRDQITILHDLNQDGEADYYENFNNDCMVAENFHAFTLNLETDSKGNFYYAYAAPWPPDVKSPHQGLLFQLTPDGKTLTPFADGLRGPNGMAIGPNDLITYSDNEGHWLPTCSLQWVRPGGFHGMKPTAHMHETVPDDFEKPICWIPHDVDNSPGDQIWVTSPRWGPLQGKMLLTSYGKSSLSLVLLEQANQTWQGGTLKLPLRFPSGIIRGRFNPHDDHLYLCGLSVWQTTGVRPGGFYRVRYTGQPLHTPLDLKVKPDGLELTFSDPLQADSATDPQNYFIEQWNYRWIERYGSPHFSVKNPNQTGHDEVTIRSATLTPDGKTLFLKTEPLSPVMQMNLSYRLQGANGERIRHNIYNTINTIPMASP